jgi:hypothetical protein
LWPYWCIFWPFSIFVVMMVHFMAVWYFCGHFDDIFPFWFVVGTK